MTSLLCSVLQQVQIPYISVFFPLSYIV